MTRASLDHTHAGQWCHPCVEHGAAKMLDGVAEAEKVRRAMRRRRLWPFAVLGLLAGIYPALVILAMVTSGSNLLAKSSSSCESAR